MELVEGVHLGIQGATIPGDCEMGAKLRILSVQNQRVNRRVPLRSRKTPSRRSDICRVNPYTPDRHVPDELRGSGEYLLFQETTKQPWICTDSG
jgi:hypothetical protein